MEVNDQLVENLANLARLQFSDTEKAAIRKDLERMISFVEKLREVDTEGTDPLLHMSSVTNVFREDIVHGSMKLEDALQNAPSADGTYFRVPKVIKKQ